MQARKRRTRMYRADGPHGPLARGALSAFACTLVLALAAALSFSALAHAEPSYTGTVTGVVESYETVEGDTAIPAYLYLNLSVDEPIHYGTNNYFYLYGRVAGDLGAEDFTESRLYSAFWNVEGLPMNADVRLGRQFMYNVAGFSLMDGVQARFNNVGKFADITLYGGGDVSFEEHYDSNDLVYGISVDMSGARDLSLGASYMHKIEAGEDSREDVGVSAGYRIKDMGRLDAEVRYDLITEATDYYSLLAKAYLPKNTTASVSYSYHLPYFDANDVWAVFGGDEYKDLTFTLEHLYAGKASLYASVSKLMYEEGSDTSIVDVGLKLIDMGGWSFDASINSQTGEDEISGCRIGGRYRSEKYNVGAGFETDNYQRYEMSSNETATMLYADAKYYIDEASSVSLRVEQRDSEISDADMRATLRVQHAFGGAR